MKSNPLPARFVTLTFDQESYNHHIANEKDENTGAAKAVRLFLERWRKKTGKSVKHWLITEKGEDYNRIHLHGLLFTNKSEKFIRETWGYGFIFIGDYCNEKTINYITKYVLKIDTKHENFKGLKLCSAGIGSKWIEKRTPHMYKGEQTQESIRLSNGQRVNMPIYYRNKTYSETERENLWIQKIEKQERYINGMKFNMKDPDEVKRFYQVLESEQQKNEEMKYGKVEWSQKKYSKKLEEFGKLKNKT